MKVAQAKKLVEGLVTNAGMITVYRHNSDDTVSAVYRTFRVDSVVKYLARKSGRHSVEQAK